MSLTSGSSARDRDDRADSAAPLATPQELPENVIPLRAAVPAIVPPVATPAQDSPRLQEADAANPDHQPTPIFGRAALQLPEWPTVLVFCAIAMSVLIVLLDSFRAGALAFGASMTLAFFLRLVLTDREAGMLKVRSRGVDLLILGSFAVTITLLAFSVPTLG